MSGGGFFNSQGGAGGSQGESPGNRRTADKSTVRPVTIRQVVDAYQPHPDADFAIDSVDVAQVSFCAKVLGITRGTTNVSYVVEDGTGQVDVRQWTESADDDTGKSDGIEQDCMIRVIGNIKLFGGKRHVSATHVYRVTDFNEQQYHLLEAIYVHLHMTRGPLDTSGQAAGVAAPIAAANGSNYSNAAQSRGGQDNRLQDFTNPNQRKIMSYLFKLGPVDSLPSDGVPITQIVKGSGVQHDIVVMEVENLVAEGHLYTTSDDEHVLPTA